MNTKVATWNIVIVEWLNLSRNENYGHANGLLLIFLGDDLSKQISKLVKLDWIFCTNVILINYMFRNNISFSQ